MSGRLAANSEGIQACSRQSQMSELARFGPDDHVRFTSGMPPALDLLAAMSGFERSPSGVPSGPDVADSPGVRGKMTLSRHSSNDIRLGLKWYIPFVERHRLHGDLATLLLIGGSDLMYCAIALRSSPVRWLNPSSIASAMRPSAAS